LHYGDKGFRFGQLHKLGIHRETVKKYFQENRPPGELRRANIAEITLLTFFCE